MTKVRILDRKQIHYGEISIRRDDFFLNGKTISKVIVEHSPSVGLIPLIDDDKILLVKQYRHAAGKTLLEIPAGKIERKETKKQAAHRELIEETGYDGKISLLTSWYLAPGYDTELMYVFIANNLKKIRNAVGYDDDENIELKIVNINEAIKMCVMGKINDCKTIAALYLYYFQNMLKAKTIPF